MDERLNRFEKSYDKINFGIDTNGKYGYIISPKYGDMVLYLPIVESATFHHDVTLRFTLGRLFKEEKEELFKDFVEATNNIDTYMDSQEVVKSSFMASIGTLVFLNTSTEYFDSGILFVPEELDDFQKEKMNETLSFLNNGDDLTTQIVTVPKIDKILNGEDIVKCYDIKEFNQDQNIK